MKLLENAKTLFKENIPLVKDLSLSESELDSKLAKVFTMPHNDAVDMMLSMYIGQKCKFCKKEFKSLDDIREKNSVIANNEPFEMACKKCWDDKP